MKIIVTLKELLDNGIWDKFCEIKGWNIWCIKEGSACSSDEVVLSAEDCHKIGYNIKEN